MLYYKPTHCPDTSLQIHHAFNLSSLSFVDDVVLWQTLSSNIANCLCEHSGLVINMVKTKYVVFVHQIESPQLGVQAFCNLVLEVMNYICTLKSTT